jgi:cytochrome c oxidase subunit 2
MPKAASTVAGDVDELYYFLYWLSVVLFIGIVGAMTWFAMRYKRKSATEIPHGPHHHTILEVTWTVIPLVLVMVIFVWGFKGYLNMAVAPGNALPIQVTASQWQWAFQYPNGVTHAMDEKSKEKQPVADKGWSTLRVPAGRPIKLIMRSNDVLHSFWIPEFRVKHDIVPGQYSTIWFEAKEPGEYRAFCTEYCGQDHSMMMARVIVMKPEDYEAWMKQKEADAAKQKSPVELGELAYLGKSCAGCHTINGAPSAGPTFKGLFGKKEEMADGSSVTVDENYLRESILDPRAKTVKGFGPVMPVNFKDQLSEPEITGLIEYIKTLK